MRAADGAEDAGAPGTRSLGRSPLALLAPPALFAVLTAAVFWPLVSRLDDGVLRGPTDGAQVMRHLWMLDRTGETPFTAERDPLVGAPEGVALAPALEFAQPLQPTVLWLLSRVLSEQAAFNLFLLVGVALTAWVSYLLLRRLRLHPLAAVFGSTLVAFSPWLVERALEGHAALAHAWPLLLLVLALVAARERPTATRAALAGAALGLCFFTTAYLGLLGALVALVFGVLHVALAPGERRRATLHAALAAAVTGVTLIPAAVAYALDREGVDRLAGHSAAELASYSARLDSYVRPAPQHPLFGALGEEPRLGTADGERVLYLGFATIALASLGAVLLLRRRSPIRADSARFALAGALVLAPAAFLLSLPPRVELGGIELPLPSALLGELTSFYRVYARFGFVLLVALALLAAAALDVLVRRGDRRSLALAGGGAALVVFELFPGRLPVWTPELRPHDRWLAAQPPGILANYPLPTDQQAANVLALEEQARQPAHGQPLFALGSGGTGGTREQAIRIVTRYLDRPATPGVLAAEGVRYVAVHDDVYRAQGQESPPVPDSLRPLAEYGGVRVYAVEAEPADVAAELAGAAAEIAAVLGLADGRVVFSAAGFNDAEEFRPGESWRWMTQAGRLELEAEDAGLYRLEGLAFSSRQPRRLELVDERGDVLASTEVATSMQPLVLGPLTLPRGRTTVSLLAAPGPEPLGGADTRLGSVFLSPLRLLPLPEFARPSAQP